MSFNITKQEANHLATVETPSGYKLQLLENAYLLISAKAKIGKMETEYRINADTSIKDYVIDSLKSNGFTVRDNNEYLLVTWA